jgi:CubicO group peptidase (beta-lactamase class C family)
LVEREYPPVNVHETPGLASLSIVSDTARQFRMIMERRASSGTFGHGGKESSNGFADPELGLAVSLIFNGMTGERKHDRRLKQTLAKVYEALTSS